MPAFATPSAGNFRPAGIGGLSQRVGNTSRPFESSFEGLKQRFASDVADTGQEQRRFGAGLSSSIAQKFGTVGGSQQAVFAGNLSQIGRKAKARSRIAGRGDAAIKGQQLKDRISIARQGLSRRGLSQRAGQSAERARAGLDASLQASKDQVGSAIFGAAGAIAGGATRGIADKFFTNRAIDKGNQEIFNDPSLF